MKKFISAFIACSLALLTFASCGSKSKDDKKDGKTADIEGKWALSDVPDSEINSAGLIFGNNGSGSMYEPLRLCYRQGVHKGRKRCCDCYSPGQQHNCHEET